MEYKIPLPRQDYKVLCRCSTFNHAQYIEDTMKGFVMQETTFPYICAIQDDCSTDGEQQVICGFLDKEFDMSNAISYETDYAKIIITNHKGNSNCTFIVYLLKFNHYTAKIKKGKYLAPLRDICLYEAPCEGDDYWIYPQKLQMQASFLDSHSDYCLLHTDFDLTKGRRNHLNAKNAINGNCIPKIITEGIEIGTLTTMYRISTLKSLPKLYRGKGWPMGDAPLWIEFACAGNIQYFPVVTAKYRVLNNSASHSQDINKLISFYNAAIEMKRFYAQKNGIELENDGLSKKYYQNMIRYGCRLNNYDVAKKYYIEAKKVKLLSAKGWLFYLSSKYPIIKKAVELYIKA